MPVAVISGPPNLDPKFVLRQRNNDDSIGAITGSALGYAGSDAGHPGLYEVTIPGTATIPSGDYYVQGTDTGFLVNGCWRVANSRIQVDTSWAVLDYLRDLMQNQTSNFANLVGLSNITAQNRQL